MAEPEIEVPETEIHDAETPGAQTPRCGFAAVLGAPNAGKSTLVNRLVGQKVSIVTHKAQTTRFQVRGVFVAGEAQIVLVDTPGVFAPKRRLDRAMVRAAWDGVSDADVVLHIVDAAVAARAKGVPESAAPIVEGLADISRPKVLVLNKIDAIPREALLPVVEAFNDRVDYAATFLISALNGDGVEDLRAALVARAPQGPWHYPEDQVADLPLRLLAAEITREHLFMRLHEELPYSLTVETESWQEREDGSARVEQTIFVSREGHRKIVLGAGGRAIKSVGQAARLELQDMLERPIHLFLHVKVRENWMDERARFAALGLDFSD